eukprot:g9400.t1
MDLISPADLLGDFLGTGSTSNGSRSDAAKEDRLKECLNRLLSPVVDRLCHPQKTGLPEQMMRCAFSADHARLATVPVWGPVLYQALVREKTFGASWTQERHCKNGNGFLGARCLLQIASVESSPCSSGSSDVAVAGVDTSPVEIMREIRLQRKAGAGKVSEEGQVSTNTEDLEPPPLMEPERAPAETSAKVGLEGQPRRRHEKIIQQERPPRPPEPYSFCVAAIRSRLRRCHRYLDRSLPLRPLLWVGCFLLFLLAYKRVVKLFFAPGAGVEEPGSTSKIKYQPYHETPEQQLESMARRYTEADPSWLLQLMR